mgnify:CR=1 FL=1
MASGVTLGTWLDAVEEFGWSAERVWLAVRRAALDAVNVLRGSLRNGEADELIQETILVARERSTAWNRPGLQDTRLAGWILGIARKCLKAMRRKELALLGERAHDIPASTGLPVEGASPPPSAPENLAQILTARQLDAWQLACEGFSHAEGARRLGISRDAFRDRLRRAKRAIASGTPAPRRDTREDCRRIASECEIRGDARGALLFARRAAQWTYRAIAEAVGASVAAVRSALARRRRRAQLPVGPIATETDLPPATCSSEKSARHRAEPGRDRGDDREPVAQRYAPSARFGRGPPSDNGPPN